MYSPKYFTETDLLGGKNFGETSLVEIRDLMAQHGLRVGQNLAPTKVKEVAPAASWSGGVGVGLGFLQTPDLSPQEQANLAQGV